MHLTTYHFNIMGTRICTKCGEEKPETTEYFYRQKDCRGGLNTTCKVCCNKNARKWRAENPEKQREAVRRWMAGNTEKARERQKSWRAENPEKVREMRRRWKAENPEKVREEKKSANRRRVDTLAPVYLKTLISAKYDIDFSEIGDELIEAKRREMTYYRQLKQLKK